jgi:hypothetical protein
MHLTPLVIIAAIVAVRVGWRLVRQPRRGER